MQIYGNYNFLTRSRHVTWHCWRSQQKRIDKEQQ